MSCSHKHMVVDADVTWMSGHPGNGSVDIRIMCEDCEQPVHFKGMPRGLNVNGAARSVDGTEARLAIGIGADWPRASHENN